MTLKASPSPSPNPEVKSQKKKPNPIFWTGLTLFYVKPPPHPPPITLKH